jgi:hypothetical protein
MDRRQVIVQRARECFGDRLDDVLHSVRQDRQDLRGWEEPAHLRSVLRRTIREGAASAPQTTTNELAELSVVTAEYCRGAGEPERGQQREGLGQLLEAGSTALEKLTRSSDPDLSAVETLGLETTLLLYARPALCVSDNRLGSVPALWNVLEDQREEVEMAQRGVGRIELLGHPEYDWAGTGFLVNETCLMTTRRTLEIFAEQQGETWQFRPGISAWLNFRSQYQQVASAGCRVRAILGVHERYDLALLDVEPPQAVADGPVPLALAAQQPQQLAGRPVYLVGYPVRDARRNEPEPIARAFRDVYNVKRIQPGVLRGSLQFREVQLLQHDCAPLGQTGGGCIVDVETQQVLGLQLSSRYLETGTAIPLWVLRDDPLLQRAGVTYISASSQELGELNRMVERLARSRYWTEAQQMLRNLCQRAFGTSDPTGRRP